MRRVASLSCAVALVTTVPANAAEPFVGRWALTPEACSGRGSTAATAVLVAGDTTVQWFAGGSCRMHKIYKLGQTIYAQALCADGKNIPITLDARGDRMKVIWAGGKPEELQRCK